MGTSLWQAERVHQEHNCICCKYQVFKQSGGEMSKDPCWYVEISLVLTVAHFDSSAFCIVSKLGFKQWWYKTTCGLFALDFGLLWSTGSKGAGFFSHANHNFGKHEIFSVKRRAIFFHGWLIFRPHSGVSLNHVLSCRTLASLPILATLLSQNGAT